jgi:DNA-binding response OmpR family regulator
MQKILIVDDRQDIARALSIRLQSLGYHTCLAYDAVMALHAAVQERPDLILLDICMPAGGGLSVAENMSGHADISGTPLIFMTASKDPEIREQALSLRPAGYFEKPFDSLDVVARIAEVLGSEDGA